MKQIVCTLLILVAGRLLGADEIKLLAVKGDVTVRHGAREEWTSIAAGDVLKPDDSIRSGKRSSATLLIGTGGRIVMPEEVILEVGDLRKLSQQELLLKLAMQDIRSVAPRNPGTELNIPRTTTVHGADKNSPTSSGPPVQVQSTKLQLNGTAVLYEHDFFASCVLRSKEVFLLDPELHERVDARFRVAASLEQMNLNNEALLEYKSIVAMPLGASQRAFVEQKILLLKKDPVR